MANVSDDAKAIVAALLAMARVERMGGTENAASSREAYTLEYYRMLDCVMNPPQKR